MHDFDQTYWETHWRESPLPTAGSRVPPPNPYVVDETRDLTPGTALDAGCGVGSEAIWLAGQGWKVTGVDISATALEAAADRAHAAAVSEKIEWIEADASAWEPSQRWDLVMTNYAHPAIPQLDFYLRLAQWVAPGGTILIVGHRSGDHDHGSHDEAGHPPHEATATLDGITSRLDAAIWRIETAADRTRNTGGGHAHSGTLHDVVVRATRRADDHQ
ncbi:class I SAM-dependent methyltransferase [Williamsia phyllosphaerae]|uniref:class I SAM-dependent methyltransferase n=1 Tax=Williamsia phyllosphaerae TaxID=885042 RepID=UPI0016685F2E|nr:class I SAM-dependent methyltransferase [Williamsia phyllosphaerae]